MPLSVADLMGLMNAALSGPTLVAGMSLPEVGMVGEVAGHNPQFYVVLQMILTLKLRVDRGVTVGVGEDLDAGIDCLLNLRGEHVIGKGRLAHPVTLPAPGPPVR